jgi:hypothetical protein
MHACILTLIAFSLSVSYAFAENAATPISGRSKMRLMSYPHGKPGTAAQFTAEKSVTTEPSGRVHMYT